MGKRQAGRRINRPDFEATFRGNSRRLTGNVNVEAKFAQGPVPNVRHPERILPFVFRRRRVSEEILEILHSVPKGIATAAHQTDIYLVLRQPEYLVRAIPQDF